MAPPAAQARTSRRRRLSAAPQNRCRRCDPGVRIAMIITVPGTIIIALPQVMTASGTGTALLVMFLAEVLSTVECFSVPQAIARVAGHSVGSRRCHPCGGLAGQQAQHLADDVGLLVLHVAMAGDRRGDVALAHSTRTRPNCRNAGVDRNRPAVAPGWHDKRRHAFACLPSFFRAASVGSAAGRRPIGSI